MDYTHPYVDELIAAGRLPENISVANSTVTQVTDAGYGTTITATSTMTGDNNKTHSSTPNNPSQPANKTPTLDASKSGTYIVVDENTKSYEAANKDVEVKTWNLAEKVDVKGLMSNGYYKVVYNEKEQYIDKKHLVPLDKYEAAWKETEKVESECDKEGHVKYVNDLTGEVKEETLVALGHAYQVSSEALPTCTETGSITSVCATCNVETIEEVAPLGHTPTLICEECENVIVMGNAISPATIGLGGIVLLVVIGCGVFFVFKNKKK